MSVESVSVCVCRSVWVKNLNALTQKPKFCMYVGVHHILVIFENYYVYSRSQGYYVLFVLD